MFTFILQNLSLLQYHNLAALLLMEMLPMQTSVSRSVPHCAHLIRYLRFYQESTDLNDSWI